MEYLHKILLETGWCNFNTWKIIAEVNFLNKIEIFMY